MKQNDDPQYAVEAVNIYHNILEPLLQKIRNLKYGENFVYQDDNDYCRLIQNKYSISDINIASTFNHKVKAFDIGIKSKKEAKKVTKNKKTFIIESDESVDQEEKEDITKIPQNDFTIGEGKDGIEWNNPKYKNLWSRFEL